MMRLIIFLPLLIGGAAIAQEDNKVTIKVINEQVWKPFKESFDTKDWQSFNDLHTDNVLRINRWGIRVGEEYKSSIKESYQRKDDRQRVIDFAFDERVYKHDIGYETGYYRVTYTMPDNSIKETYGRFHVRLEKENNRWKIAQDWDTDKVNGVAVGEEDFEKGQRLEL